VVHQRVSFQQELGSEIFSQVTIENPDQGAVTINVPQPTTPAVDAEENTFSAVGPNPGMEGSADRCQSTRI
jgi:hypothetical protein